MEEGVMKQIGTMYVVISGYFPKEVSDEKESPVTDAHLPRHIHLSVGVHDNFRLGPGQAAAKPTAPAKPAAQRSSRNHDMAAS